jgi:hypothetical protein
MPDTWPNKRSLGFAAVGQFRIADNAAGRTTSYSHATLPFAAAEAAYMRVDLTIFFSLGTFYPVGNLYLYAGAAGSGKGKEQACSRMLKNKSGWEWNGWGCSSKPWVRW